MLKHTVPLTNGMEQELKLDAPTSSVQGKCIPCRIRLYSLFSQAQDPIRSDGLQFSIFSNTEWAMNFGEISWELDQTFELFFVITKKNITLMRHG